MQILLIFASSQNNREPRETEEQNLTPETEKSCHFRQVGATDPSAQVYLFIKAGV